MNKYEVIVRCWEKGHETKELMTKKQEEKLVANIASGRVLCPVCKSRLALVSGSTIFNMQKSMGCSAGHMTTIGAFSNDTLHVRFGHGDEDFLNTSGRPEELQEILDTKEIVCYHKNGEQVCGCSLEPLDDTLLEIPHATSIKTRTRVGDLWDKAKAEPVRNGSYDGDGNYSESRTRKSNLERLKRIRKNRNIPVDRHPGTKMDRPTDNVHGPRNKNSIDFS